MLRHPHRTTGGRPDRHGSPIVDPALPGARPITPGASCEVYAAALVRSIQLTALTKAQVALADDIGDGAASHDLPILAELSVRIAADLRAWDRIASKLETVRVCDMDAWAGHHIVVAVFEDMLTTGGARVLDAQLAEAGV